MLIDLSLSYKGKLCSLISNLTFVAKIVRFSQQSICILGLYSFQLKFEIPEIACTDHTCTNKCWAETITNKQKVFDSLVSFFTHIKRFFARFSKKFRILPICISELQYSEILKNLWSKHKFYGQWKRKRNTFCSNTLVVDSFPSLDAIDSYTLWKRNSNAMWFDTFVIVWRVKAIKYPFQRI